MCLQNDVPDVTIILCIRVCQHKTRLLRSFCLLIAIMIVLLSVGSDILAVNFIRDNDTDDLG